MFALLACWTCLVISDINETLNDSPPTVPYRAGESTILQALWILQRVLIRGRVRFFSWRNFSKSNVFCFSPHGPCPRESLSANRMSKLNLAHLFPREQRRIPTEDEWFIIRRRPALVLPPLSRARHLWRSLIITSVIKRVEFFISLSLSNTSFHNRLSPSNGTVHLARTSWHSLPRPPHIISSLFITFTLSNVI